MITELLTRHEKENEILKKEINELFNNNIKSIWKNDIVDIIDKFFNDEYPELKKNYIVKIIDIDSNNKEFEFFVSYDNIARSFSLVVKKINLE